MTIGVDPNDVFHNDAWYDRSGNPLTNAALQTAEAAYAALAEQAVASSVKTMVDADVVFTIAGGPIEINSLHSELIAVGSATASTMQWKSNPTVGVATTISGASTGLGSGAVPAAGATVLLTPTALSTAPTIALASAGGVQLGLVAQNRIHVNAGTLSLVIGVGSTTSTWKHYLRYKPLAPGVTVTGT